MNRNKSTAARLSPGVYDYFLPPDFWKAHGAVFEIGQKKRELLLVEIETIASRLEPKILGVPTWYAIDRGRIWIFPAPIEPSVLRLLYSQVYPMHGWLPKRRDA